MIPDSHSRIGFLFLLCFVIILVAMILKEFSDYIKENENKSSVSLLYIWLKSKIESPAKSNVDKILQKEIYIAKNKIGATLFIAKSPSGRNLIKSLYNFALSYEQQKMARWIHNKKANNFKNCKNNNK